jgi:hypothetical protein
VQRQKLGKGPDLLTRYRKIGIRAVAAAAQGAKEATAPSDEKLKRRAKEGRRSPQDR